MIFAKSTVAVNRIVSQFTTKWYDVKVDILMGSYNIETSE